MYGCLLGLFAFCFWGCLYTSLLALLHALLLVVVYPLSVVRDCFFCSLEPARGVQRASWASYIWPACLLGSVQLKG
jgi:hypothetical protein